MDHKSDSGKTVQDTCCGRTMAILHFKLVNYEVTHEVSATENGTSPEDDTNYGTKLIK